MADLLIAGNYVNIGESGSIKSSNPNLTALCKLISDDLQSEIGQMDCISNMIADFLVETLGGKVVSYDKPPSRENVVY